MTLIRRTNPFGEMLSARLAMLKLGNSKTAQAALNKSDRRARTDGQPRAAGELRK